MSYFPKENKSWDVIDSTKLTDYIECPRMFYYKYILGWRTTEVSNHLWFGECWHRAMEHLLLNGYSNESIVGAYKVFEESYREKFDPDTDELFAPKIPSNVLPALAQYCETWREDCSNEKVHYTEISGSVSLSDNRLIFFRMDSILEDSQGRIFSRDHKTKGGYFSRTWEQDFYISIQGWTYTHALKCLYDPEKVRGIEFNGVSFAKTKAGATINFKRVPCWYSNDQMQNMYWSIVSHCNRLEHDLENYTMCKEGDRILQAFPLQGTRCSKYFGCEFLDFCTTWSNPLKHCFEPPLGFTQEFWDPREKDSKFSVEL